jgi:peptide-methionine (S)-S-oxide reductase
VNGRSIVVAFFAACICISPRVRADGGEVSPATSDKPATRTTDPQSTPESQLEKATLGLGCYSCAEAMFKRLKGVRSVEVGYSGGDVKYPNDEQISSGRSGHAEVVQITYDPTVLTYADLLEVFWKIHDPTTLNRQGKNVGSQYRSVIFYHTDKQKDLAEHYKEKLTKSNAFADPIVTEILSFKEFYPAAKSHRDFFRLNPNDQYCTLVIQPKVEAFEKAFADRLQPEPPAKDKQP